MKSSEEKRERIVPRFYQAYPLEYGVPEMGTSETSPHFRGPRMKESSETLMDVDRVAGNVVDTFDRTTFALSHLARPLPEDLADGPRTPPLSRRQSAKDEATVFAATNCTLRTT